MTDAENREIAEALFKPDHSREEIKGAIKLDEERRTGLVKNLNRLRALRSCREKKPTSENVSGAALIPAGNSHQQNKQAIVFS